MVHLIDFYVISGGLIDANGVTEHRTEPHVTDRLSV